MTSLIWPYRQQSRDRVRVLVGAPLLAIGAAAGVLVSVRLLLALRSTGDYLYIQDFPDPVLMPLSILLLLTGLGLTVSPLKRARVRDLPPTCPRCKYELTGLSPNAACPECGKTR